MRPLYLVGGILSMLLGLIGTVLPIMPTVPFLLLAAFCFARSNPEWEAKLIAHPKWGPQLRNWRERRAIARTAKIAALTAMTAGSVITWVFLGAPWVYISLAVTLIAGSWIATRNE